MKVICEKLPSKSKPCVAAIGVFDGLHLGHQHILSCLLSQAKKQNQPALVITFDTPPPMILPGRNTSDHNARKYFPGFITSKEQKIELLKESNVDILWFLPTNRKLLQLSGEEFLRYVLAHFNITTLVVGQDFRFGRIQSQTQRS